MAVESIMGGFAVAKIHPKLSLYLKCSPELDLKYRCLPREGGLYNQDYVDTFYFNIIERRIIDFRNRELEKIKHAKKVKK